MYRMMRYDNRINTATQETVSCAPEAQPLLLCTGCGETSTQDAGASHLTLKGAYNPAQGNRPGYRVVSSSCTCIYGMNNDTRDAGASHTTLKGANIPAAAIPGYPENVPAFSFTFSGCPENFPALTFMFSGCPENFPALTFMFSGCPENFPALTFKFSGCPENFPALTFTFSGLPRKRLADPINALRSTQKAIWDKKRSKGLLTIRI
jgi:hypothetical protein